MPQLYLTKSTHKVGLNEGQVYVFDTHDGSTQTFPFNRINGISLFGASQISTQLIRRCIESNVPILFYSEDGHYFGNINSSTGINPTRQKQQIVLTDNDSFCLRWAKRIVLAKIWNSISLLNSMPDVYVFPETETRGLHHSLSQLKAAESMSAVLGFEGNAAKSYFSCLPKLLLNDTFSFCGRSSRPPRDAFNSMLSFGYSLLYNVIIGAIEQHGLHPYFAYMHQMKNGHAALASDLIEEHRAFIVDRTIVKVVNGGELTTADFYTNPAGAIYMNRRAMHVVANEITSAMAMSLPYFRSYDDNKAYTFHSMLSKSMRCLVDAIEARDATLYQPFVWIRE